MTLGNPPPLSPLFGPFLFLSVRMTLHQVALFFSVCRTVRLNEGASQSGDWQLGKFRWLGGEGRDWEQGTNCKGVGPSEIGHPSICLMLASRPREIHGHKLYPPSR